MRVHSIIDLDYPPIFSGRWRFELQCTGSVTGNDARGDQMRLTDKKVLIGRKVWIANFERERERERGRENGAAVR